MYTIDMAGQDVAVWHYTNSAIYNHIVDASGPLILGFKLDFSSFVIWDSFYKPSHTYSYVVLWQILSKLKLMLNSANFQLLEYICLNLLSKELPMLYKTIYSSYMLHSCTYIFIEWKYYNISNVLIMFSYYGCLL